MKPNHLLEAVLRNDAEFVLDMHCSSASTLLWAVDCSISITMSSKYCHEPAKVLSNMYGISNPSRRILSLTESVIRRRESRAVRRCRYYRAWIENVSTRIQYYNPDIPEITRPSLIHLTRNRRCIKEMQLQLLDHAEISDHTIRLEEKKVVQTDNKPPEPELDKVADTTTVPNLSPHLSTAEEVLPHTEETASRGTTRKSRKDGDITDNPILRIHQKLHTIIQKDVGGIYSRSPTEISEDYLQARSTKVTS